MMQAFLEAQEYIEHIPKFVKKNTMEDTKAFYQRLSCPCIDSKVIHVAGTNGKGSVCAYLQSVLMEAGYRVGMFTSPHLVDIRERIRMDRELIPEEDFAEAFMLVKEICGKEDGGKTANCSNADAERIMPKKRSADDELSRIIIRAILNIYILWQCSTLKKSIRIL